ncbi:MAG TPA: hypothetical protein PK794_10060, partial [Armatimonadota bacterium]|nr:hypothetical protein [Armatimonadota bacterium]
MRVHCLLVLLGLAVLMTAAAAQQRVRVQEYLGRTWTDELISFPLDPALRRARSLAVTDAAGAPVPYQRAGHRIYFLVTLPADGELVYTIRPGRATPAERRVRVTDAGGMLTLDSGVMALRLPDGGARYRPSADPATVPGPLQGVRLGAGGWIGTSWLQAPMPVTGYAATLTAAGPLFADAAVEYAFAGGKRYRFSVRVIAGQPTAIIDEQMDVNPGGAYALLRPADDVD